MARCSYNYTVACSAPEGKITDFNVWDRALTLQEAMDWTSCRQNPIYLIVTSLFNQLYSMVFCRKEMKGNLVNWDTAKFEVENMMESNIPMEKVCVPLRPGHVVMPTRMNFTSHLSLCHKFRGKMSVVKEEETQDALGEALKKHPQCGYMDGGV